MAAQIVCLNSEGSGGTVRMFSGDFAVLLCGKYTFHMVWLTNFTFFVSLSCEIMSMSMILWLPVTTSVRKTKRERRKEAVKMPKCA